MKCFIDKIFHEREHHIYAAVSPMKKYHLLGVSNQVDLTLFHHSCHVRMLSSRLLSITLFSPSDFNATPKKTNIPKPNQSRLGWFQDLHLIIPRYISYCRSTCEKTLQTFLDWFDIENKNSGHFAKLLTSALLQEKCF